MSIRETIYLDLTEYKQQTRRASEESQRMARTMEGDAKQASGGVTQAFKRIGQAAHMFITGIAIGALYKLGQMFREVASEAKRSDAAFNKSFAIMGDLSETQKNRMIAAARETSKELNIELDKVAESYFFLASAGLDAEQQLKALPIVANFAKAGMFDMALATDLLTDAQSSLGLTIRDDVVANMKNMNRVSDVLVKANTLANATVQQFSESLTNRAGAALRLVNKDIEEGIAVLAAMADQGVKGAEAGTRLEIVLRDLQKSSITSREEFDRMNITVFDSEGRMRNLADILGDLEVAMAGMSDEQKRVTITQLGFQERSVSAILSVLGLSDAIRDYESGLRDAGGTTQEITDKQLKSLDERLGLLKRAFATTFGPGFLTMMEKALEGVERLSGSLTKLNSRFNDSPAEKVLKSLRDLDAPESLIQLFERQVAIDDARQVRDDIEAELAGLQVPIEIDKKSVVEQAQGFVSELFSRFGKFDPLGWKTLFESIPNAMDEIDSLKFQTEAFDSKKIDEYRGLVENLSRQIIQYSEVVADMDDDKERKRLSGVISKMREMRGEVSNAIMQYQTYEAAVEALKQTHERTVFTPAGQSEVPEQEVPVLRATIEMSHRAVEAVNILDKEIRSLADIKMDSLTEEFETYQNQVMMLNNELESGNITQEQYNERLDRLGNTMKARLTEIYNQIRNQLSPEQRKLWQSMIKGIENTNDELDDTKSNLRDIADAVSGVLTLADAFGKVDDNVRNVLRGTIEVLRNFENMKAAEGMDAVGPALGMAAGLVSVIIGAIGSSGPSREEVRAQQQKMRDLELSLNSLRRAVQKNTQAYLSQGVVGGSVKQSDIDHAQELIDSVTGHGAIETTGRGLVPDSERQRIRGVLQELGELFPELFGNALERFDQMLESGMNPQLALQQLGLGRLLTMLDDNLGEFGNSLAGIITRFEMSINLGGVGIQQAVERFIQDMSELEGVSPELKARLLKILDIDLTTEEGRKQLDELIADIYEDRADLMGDLSPDDFRELLEFIQRFGSDSAFGESADSGFSRSVQIARTITDVQANEVIMLLEAIEYWTRQTAAALGNNTALSLPQNAFGAKAFEIPIPLPVEVMNFPEHEAYLSHTVNNESHHTVNIGGITIQAPPGSDPGGIDMDRLANDLGWIIRKDIRSQTF